MAGRGGARGGSGAGRGGAWAGQGQGGRGRGSEVSAPGGAGRSPCTASRRGGPPLPGCSWKRGGRAEGVPGPAPRPQHRQGPTDPGPAPHALHSPPAPRSRAEGRGTPPAAPGPSWPRTSRGPLPHPARAAQARDSLAVGLQLADLEVDQQVVLAVAGPWAGPRQCAELGGRHWGDREEMWVQTGHSWVRLRRGGREQTPSSGKDTALHGEDWRAPPQGTDRPRPPPLGGRA